MNKAKLEGPFRGRGIHKMKETQPSIQSKPSGGKVSNDAAQIIDELEWSCKNCSYMNSGQACAACGASR